MGAEVGCEETGSLVGWLCPGSPFSVAAKTSKPLVTRGLPGTLCAVLTARAWLELEVLWARTDGDITVLSVTLVTGVVRWDPREVGGLEVAPGEATGLEEGPGSQEGCRGVVLTGKESRLRTVTALVVSGRRGTGGDREETVVLGLPAKVAVTLVVSVVPDTVPDVGVCGELKREDEDPGR